MADATVTPTDNGPYIVTGNFTLVDGEGNEFEVDGEAWLCRCGQSSNKPFCDDTHLSVEFDCAPRAR